MDQQQLTAGPQRAPSRFESVRPAFDASFRSGFFFPSSHTSDLKIGTSVAR